MSSRKNKVNTMLHVEVLQNGIAVANTTQLTSNSRKLHLTNRYDSALSIPLHPDLHDDIELFDISKGSVSLIVNAGWRGFLTASGEIETLSGKERSKRVVPLKTGDYGSLALGELRVIFKLAVAKPAKTAVKQLYDKSYRGSFWQIWLGGRADSQAFGIAAVAAAIAFGGVVFGLALRADDRPKVLAEVAPQYSLPFIHEGHLRHIPEAMQSRLDRRNYIRATIDYIDGMTAALTGVERPTTNLLLPSTKRQLALETEIRREALQAAVVEAESRESVLLAKTGTAALRLPSVLGQDLYSEITKINRRYLSLHQAYDMALARRLEATKLYRQLESYDPTVYRPSEINKRKSSAEAFGQINPFVQPTNEEAMYKTASTLADQAKAYRARIDAARPASRPASDERPTIVRIPAAVSYLSFSSTQPLTSSLNSKITEIRASEFGIAAQSEIREPVIGELDPALIEQVIERQKYELQLCYELALRRNQVASGSMEWSWLIDTRGRISDLKLVSSTIADRAMERCIAEKIARWNFPRPRRGSVEIRYPFSFAPARG